MTLVLRVFSKAGRTRFDGLDASTSITTIRAQAAEKFGVDADSLSLALTPDGPSLSLDDTLQQLNLTSGAILHANTNSSQGTLSMAGQSALQGKSLTLNDLAPEPSVTDDRGPKSPSSQDSGKPKFQSFDAWVKVNGYNTSTLPLLQNFTPRELTRGTMFKIPPSITLKHQSYRHIDHVELMNIAAVTDFVTYWQHEKQTLVQRIGILYGYYAEYDHYDRGVKVVVESIYEPTQVGSADGVECDVANIDFSIPDQVARGLGLERVGIILTHLTRDGIALSAQEVITCAKWGLRNIQDEHYTRYPHTTQVIVTVSPDADSGNPIPNAFMISDLGLAMFRDGLLGEPAKNNIQRICVQESSSHVLVSEVLEGGKQVKDLENELKNTFDVDWLLVRLNDAAPRVSRSIIPLHRFPVSNRLVISNAHLDRFLKGHPKTWKTIADWNFLLYLNQRHGEKFSTRVAQAIQNRQDIPEDLWMQIAST